MTLIYHHCAVAIPKANTLSTSHHRVVGKATDRVSAITGQLPYYFFTLFILVPLFLLSTIFLIPASAVGESQDSVMECYLPTPSGWQRVPDGECWTLGWSAQWKIRIHAPNRPLNIHFLDLLGRIHTLFYVIPHGDIVLTEYDAGIALLNSRAEMRLMGPHLMVVVEADNAFQYECLAALYTHMARILLTARLDIADLDGCADLRPFFMRADCMLRDQLPHIASLYNGHGGFFHVRPVLMLSVLEEEKHFRAAAAAYSILLNFILTFEKWPSQEDRKAVLRQAAALLFQSYPHERYPDGHKLLCVGLGAMIVDLIAVKSPLEAESYSERFLTQLDKCALGCDDVFSHVILLVPSLSAGAWLISVRPDYAEAIMEKALHNARRSILYSSPASTPRDLLLFGDLLLLKCRWVQKKISREELVRQIEETIWQYDYLGPLPEPINKWSMSPAIVAELLTMAGYYDRSIPYWRANLMRLPLDKSHARISHTHTAENLLRAVSSALLAGEYSDALVFLKRLEDCNKLYYDANRAMPEVLLKTGICYFLLGEEERAKEAALAGLEKILQNSSYIMTRHNITQYALLQVLYRILTGSEMPDDQLRWNDLMMLQTTDEQVRIIYHVICILQAQRMSGGIPDPQVTESALRDVQMILNRLGERWNYLLPILQSAHRQLQILSAIQKMRQGDLDVARSLLDELRRSSQEADDAWNHAVQADLLAAEYEYVQRAGQEVSLELLEAYYREQLRMALKRMRWGSFGVCDPFQTQLRQVEARYLLEAQRCGIEATKVFAKKLARHRLDYRVSTANRKARDLAMREGGGANKNDRSAPDGTTTMNATVSQDLKWDAAYYNATGTKDIILEPYGNVSLLVTLAQEKGAFPSLVLPDLDTIESWETPSVYVPSEAAIVDFVRAETESAARYMVFVCQNVPATGEQMVEWLDLGDAKDVDEAIRQWRQAIEYGGTSDWAKSLLRARLWEPVEPLLRPGVRRVYFVPDGPLCQVPWCALPGRKPNTVLLEDYTIALLPYSGFIVDRRYHEQPPFHQRPGPQFLLVGAVDYDGNGEALAKQGSTGRSKDTSSRWLALPYTAQEIDMVSSMLPPQQTHLLTGSAASSVAVARHLRRVEWVHLATHGFFLDPNSSTLASGTPNERHMFVARRHPLILSGLVLAGANQGDAQNLLGMPLNESALLTGRAIADMPLSHLRMVILSACETGAGVAVGEGTVGLQRAFHLAGAENVIASQWRLDDHTTSLLMRLFYGFVFHEHMPPIEALRQAQLILLRSPDQLASLASLRGPEVTKAARRLQPSAFSSRTISEKFWAGFIFSGPGL